VSHHITLQPSGRSYYANGEQSVLKAGLDAGLDLPYSCFAGMCRTCQGRVISGSVDYGASDPDALTDQMRANGLALLCVAKPTSDCIIELRELSQHLERPKVVMCQVKAIARPAPDVAVIALRFPMNLPMRFMAGQYLNVLLPDGKKRSYSIATSPSPQRAMDLEIHVRHLPGGSFTDHVFSAMKTGDKLRIEGPLGTFYLRDDSAKPVILLASGTGFGPIKAIIEHAIKQGSQRAFTLYWGCRTRSDLYMFELPQQWAEEVSNFTFVPVLSDSSASDLWAGRTGFVHEAVISDYPDLTGHQVYACGAPVMVEAARKEFSTLCGLPIEEFFADEFLTEADLARAFT